MQQHILILGSLGFIGSHLVKYFTERGNSVIGCDLTEHSSSYYNYQKISILSPDFEALFDEYQFAVCINASGSGNVGFSVLHPLSDFETNTYSVAKVLDAIRKYQPACRYIHISSAAVYGNPVRLPVKETDATAPLSPYGFNKLMSEQLCTAYHQLYKIPVAIIRPFSVYGNGLKKQLLWDICCKLAKADKVELYGMFKDLPATIIKGTVPETLEQCKASRVSYLSIDMNCVAPEIAAANFFWDKIVPGGVIILDDYGFKKHIEQKTAFDQFAREKKVAILQLPTGQGIIFKP